MAKIKNSKEKIRFAMVGAGSTTIDFGILFLLSAFGLSSIIANFISTGIAFCFSFLANRHYTFKATSGNVKRQILLFFVITFIGIWGIQPVIIYLVEKQISSFGLEQWLMLFIAKIIATGVTLVWNYFFYSRVVFKDNPHTEIV